MFASIMLAVIKLYLKVWGANYLKLVKPDSLEPTKTGT
jgi:hypothetical protein